LFLYCSKVSTSDGRVPVIKKSPSGRYPAQTFLSEEAKSHLDEQSGILSSGAMKHSIEAYDGESNTSFLRGRSSPENQHGDSGGCSRICHTCDYEDGEMDLFMYCSKVSTRERNSGGRNTHPTLKPISLNYRIMQLFKLPDKYNQRVLIPFAGTGSEVIGCLRAGIKNITALEIFPLWRDIGNKRIEAWQNGHSTGLFEE
jgi:DNA modification methylase